MKKKKVLLIVPPIADSTMPMLAPYTLCSVLKRHNVFCTVWDASIEFLDLITDYKNLNSILARYGKEDFIKQFGLKAVQFVKKRKNKMCKFLSGLKLFSILEKDCPQITLDGIILPEKFNSVKILKKYVEIFYDLITILKDSEQFKIEIETKKINLVGFSITFENQLIFALAFAKFIKLYIPDSLVVFGGSYFSSWGYKPIDILSEFQEIDVIVRGPGEDILLALSKGVSPSNIIGVEAEVNGRVFVCSFLNSHSPKMKHNLLLPDFSDVHWTDYISESRVAPYSFFTRCYYGKCKFCNGDKNLPKRKVLESDINYFLTTIKRNDIKGIYIVDASVHPTLLRAIAKVSPRRVKWVANVRFESIFTDYDFVSKLATGGCYMLRFGFESGSQKVLDKMNKGTQLKIISEVLRLTANEGIKNHLYIMLGYPGENEEDRERTLEFLLRHKEFIYSYSISIFQVLPNTPIYMELCDKLRLNPENEEIALERIHAHIYSEKKWRNILYFLKCISEELSKTSRSNKYFYSGCIFGESLFQELDFHRDNFISFENTYVSPNFWPKYFSRVLFLSPKVRQGKYGVDLVNLITDEVIVIRRIKSREELLNLMNDILNSNDSYMLKKLMMRLQNNYILKWLKRDIEDVIQHSPN